MHQVSTIGLHKPKLKFSLNQLPRRLTKQKSLHERHKLYDVFALQAYYTLFLLRFSSRHKLNNLGPFSIFLLYSSLHHSPMRKSVILHHTFFVT